jgi:predicted ribosome quality control (RQC) complex YloA/Tae2 family protein
MRTDWLLIRRLAAELDLTLRGAGVRDGGVLPDRRPALLLRRHGENRNLCFDLFGSPPLLTVEAAETPLADEPGFARALHASLRGCVLLGVQSRRGDRLLRLSFGRRSRFGVSDDFDLYVELVPRFGNAVLVKRKRVIAAAKEFSASDNPVRAIQVGGAYAPPPLLPRPSLDGQMDSAAQDETATTLDPVWLYRRDGLIVQVYPRPLPCDPTDEVLPAASLLEALALYRAQRIGSGDRARTQMRRDRLTKRLDERERKLRAELAQVEAARAQAGEGNAERDAGVSLFATLHELPDERERSQAKHQALKHFAAYKKGIAALPHLDSRLERLQTALRSIEHLRWEAEVADDSDIGDIEQSFEGFTRAKPAGRRTAKPRRRPLLEIRTQAGSRILVGRSPTQNADLTFRIARPNDWWFHAQNVPGAHVVLQRDDRAEPPEEDLRQAAALAARHSKATGAGKVAVDYTLRKHVRAQRDAPAGLVWYTNARTLVVAPAAPSPN